MPRSLEQQSPQFAVGSQFDSFAALKYACTRATLLDVYEFVPDKVDSGRYTLNCIDKECTWYLYATAFPDTDVWRIRKSVQTHSCHGIHHAGHRNVDEEFISTEILPKIRSDSKLAPKAIENHFKEVYGVEIGYAKARRGKERALKVINGSHEEAYNSLPKYCQEIQRSNPESTVQLDIDPTTNQFKRLFICFGACAMGFASCRPLLGLDGTHLTHMYQGTISV
jgi:zinc finger SWIM domain-containing protein 3